MPGNDDKERIDRFNKEWHKTDDDWNTFMRGRAFDAKIKFFLTTDPEFEYEYKQLVMEGKLKESKAWDLLKSMGLIIDKRP